MSSTLPLPRRIAEPHRVSVLVPYPVGGALDYLCPAEPIPPEPGAIVRVPLGPREVLGVVWEPERLSQSKKIAISRLKNLSEIIPSATLPDVARRFVEWVGGYTLASPGAVLRMTLNTPSAFDAPKMRTAYRLGTAAMARVTPARQRVLEILADGQARGPSELARAAGVSPSVVQGLAKAGAVVAVEMALDRPFDRPDWNRTGVVLSPAQQAASQSLGVAVDARDYNVTLLEGVTGSGKTEIYLEAIAAAYRQDPHAQILVLLPEIALTAQWLERFERRFGVAPVEWHSDLSQSQRRRAWRAVVRGEPVVVVGARSALFLPFQNLRLIVVDEEHDPSFKQEEGVIYQARDMAVVRASLGKIPIILSSATPSLETVVNCQTGRYRRVELAHRHGGATMPAVNVVDMRETPPERGRWLSPPLHQALQETFSAGEQALLFINRRGYAPLTLCRACGYRLQCPNCSAWLVEHRFRQALWCHHCDYRIPLPEACPKCGATGELTPLGPGVERVAEEVEHYLPTARTLVLSSDQMWTRRAIVEAFARITDHQVDLVIGTQIISKGHHFPLLTLVGVVDADLGLSGGDLRASERTFQQLSQVAGRAGREAARPGRVFLQTYFPDHPVTRALVTGDKAAFYARESEERRLAGMPPFGRLAALIVSGPDEAAVIRVARNLAAQAPRSETIEVLGPAPAPMSLLRGRYRYRLLLKTTRQTAVQRVITAWLARALQVKGVNIKIDIDPYSFN